MIVDPMSIFESVLYKKGIGYRALAKGYMSSKYGAGCNSTTFKQDSHEQPQNTVIVITFVGFKFSMWNNADQTVQYIVIPTS